MIEMPHFSPLYFAHYVRDTDACCIEKILEQLVTGATQWGSENREGSRLF